MNPAIDHPHLFEVRTRLPLIDAITYVGARSDSAFRRWCRSNNVRPVRRGIYSRSQIDDAMAREERLAARIRRNIRN